MLQQEEQARDKFIQQWNNDVSIVENAIEQNRQHLRNIQKVREAQILKNAKSITSLSLSSMVKDTKYKLCRSPLYFNDADGSAELDWNYDYILL